MVRVIVEDNQDQAGVWITSAMSLESTLVERVVNEMLGRDLIPLKRDVIKTMKRLENDFVALAYTKISSLEESSATFRYVETSITQQYGNVRNAAIRHQAVVAVVLMLGANAATLTKKAAAFVSSAPSRAGSGAASAETNNISGRAQAAERNAASSLENERPADSLPTADSLTLPSNKYGPETVKAYSELLAALRVQHRTKGLDVIEQLECFKVMSDRSFVNKIAAVTGDMVEFNKLYSYPIVSRATEPFVKALVPSVQRQVEAMGSKWRSVFLHLEEGTSLSGVQYRKLNSERAAAVVLTLAACAQVCKRTVRIYALCVCKRTVRIYVLCVCKLTVRIYTYHTYLRLTHVSRWLTQMHEGLPSDSGSNYEASAHCSIVHL